MLKGMVNYGKFIGLFNGLLILSARKFMIFTRA